jgi:hypothetical protein
MSHSQNWRGGGNTFRTAFLHFDMIWILFCPAACFTVYCVTLWFRILSDLVLSGLVYSSLAKFINAIEDYVFTSTASVLHAPIKQTADLWHLAMKTVSLFTHKSQILTTVINVWQITTCYILFRNIPNASSGSEISPAWWKSMLPPLWSQLQHNRKPTISGIGCIFYQPVQIYRVRHGNGQQ